jgi:NAD(P)-dependent dehydrogenase (short-subunit alcohol dehydrogenase family)
MIAKTLAANGAKVYVGSRRNEVTQGSADEHGPKTDGHLIPYVSTIHTRSSTNVDPYRLELDVTNKESIKNAVQTIQKNEGKLDLLFNKYGVAHVTYVNWILNIIFSAGQGGPKSPFFNDESAPENKDPHTLGSAMFDAEDFQGEAHLFAFHI